MKNFDNLFTPGQAKIVFHFDIAHSGWECDSEGWVVEYLNGTRRLILTNHGSPYFAEKTELLDLLDEYEKLVQRTEKAYELIR